MEPVQDPAVNRRRSKTWSVTINIPRPAGFMLDPEWRISRSRTRSNRGSMVVSPNPTGVAISNPVGNPHLADIPIPIPPPAPVVEAPISRQDTLRPRLSRRMSSLPPGPSRLSLPPGPWDNEWNSTTEETSGTGVAEAQPPINPMVVQPEPTAEAEEDKKKPHKRTPAKLVKRKSRAMSEAKDLDSALSVPPVPRVPSTSGFPSLGISSANSSTSNISEESKKKARRATVGVATFKAAIARATMGSGSSTILDTTPSTSTVAPEPGSRPGLKRCMSTKADSTDPPSTAEHRKTLPPGSWRHEWNETLAALEGRIPLASNHEDLNYGVDIINSDRAIPHYKNPMELLRFNSAMSTNETNTVEPSPRTSIGSLEVNDITPLTSRNSDCGSTAGCNDDTCSVSAPTATMSRNSTATLIQEFAASKESNDVRVDNWRRNTLDSEDMAQYSSMQDVQPTEGYFAPRTRPDSIVATRLAPMISRPPSMTSLQTLGSSHQSSTMLMSRRASSQTTTPDQQPSRSGSTASARRLTLADHAYMLSLMLDKMAEVEESPEESEQANPEYYHPIPSPTIHVPRGKKVFGPAARQFLNFDCLSCGEYVECDNWFHRVGDVHACTGSKSQPPLVVKSYDNPVKPGKRLLYMRVPHRDGPEWVHLAETDKHTPCTIPVVEEEPHQQTGDDVKEACIANADPELTVDPEGAIELPAYEADEGLAIGSRYVPRERHDEDILSNIEEEDQEGEAQVSLVVPLDDVSSESKDKVELNESSENMPPPKPSGKGPVLAPHERPVLCGVYWD